MTVSARSKGSGNSAISLESFILFAILILSLSRLSSHISISISVPFLYLSIIYFSQTKDVPKEIAFLLSWPLGGSYGLHSILFPLRKAAFFVNGALRASCLLHRTASFMNIFFIIDIFSSLLDILHNQVWTSSSVPWSRSLSDARWNIYSNILLNRQ